MIKEKITYIFNSGFIYEDNKNVFIFDFYRSPNDNLDIVEDYLKQVSKEKNIAVFVSHGHHDHYSKEIFKWRGVRENISYIISNDVADAYSFRDENTIFLGRDESTTLFAKSVKVHSFGSTDIGLSFLVDIGEKIIFHGGDLNWWDWGDEDNEEESSFMENTFKKILKDIENYLGSKKITLAFFPVDPRMEERAYKGAQYFIESLSPEKLIPMHFGDQFQVCKKLKELSMGNKTLIGEVDSHGKIKF